VGQTDEDIRPRAVILVTSSGCHLCETAKDMLAKVARDHPLTIEVIDLASEHGQCLARTHRMPFPPMVLIDGHVHAHGRVSEKRLRRFLEAAPSSVSEGP
jgi:hypothetical protein